MPNIDERVVQMTFDNKQFESGVSESLKTLDDLKEALNFNGVEKSLKTIENAFSGVDLSGLSNAIESVADHFSPLGILAVTTMQRISNAAIDTGKKVADAFFGISDMHAGQDKYETRTRAVQTIMNATGKSIEEVEAVLDDLQTYTDETSYDFATMVDNIGKFTSVGVDLGMAEKAMEGIANEAAKSGANAQQASHAMYNFAQALSTGSVKLQDWKSIANATMATKEFKEVLIQTAIEVGTLQSEGENVGSVVTTNQQKLAAGQKALAKAQKATKDRAEKVAEAQEKIAAATKKTEVNFQTFDTTLSEGWLTSDVLITALNKYSNMETKFGQEAYYAAQRALTFTDAVQATKDAISSGWMDSFGYIFGNLEEAITLWTGVANALYEYVTIFSEWRNTILEAWHTQGGYNDLIEAASNLWQVFMNIVRGVGQALTDVFPILNTDNMTEALKDGTAYLKDASAELLEMFGLQQKVKEEEEEVTEESKEIEKETEKINENTEDLKDNMSDLGDEAERVNKNIDGVKTGLQRGMKGDDVKALQERLIALGFRLDKFGADGIFGPETQAAVKALQREIGVTETGVLDEATMAALNTEEALAKLQARAHKGLGSGDIGADVKDLQEDLNKYLDASEKLVVDGIFGPKTEARVKELQKELGVEQTGVWDEATRAALESGKMILFSVDKIRKGLKVGMVGDDVKSLQEQLIKTGYLTDQSVADGVYGPKTEAAVKALQRELGVKETGVWDQATMMAVNRSKRMQKSNSEAAKAAAESSEVVEEAAEVTEEAGEKATKTIGHTTIPMERFQNILKGWGAALKIVSKFAGSIIKIGGNILSMLGPLIDVGTRFGSVFGIMFRNLAKDLDKDDVYGKFVNSVTKAFGPFGKFIEGVAKSLHTFLDSYDEFLESTGKRNTFGSFFEFVGKKLKASKIFGPIVSFFGEAKKVINTIFALVGQLFTGQGGEGILKPETVKALNNFRDGVIHFFSLIKLLFTGSTGDDKELTEAENNILWFRDQIASVLGGIKDGIVNIWNTVTTFFGDLFSRIFSGGNGSSETPEWINTLKTTITDFVSNIKLFVVGLPESKGPLTETQKRVLDFRKNVSLILGGIRDEIVRIWNLIGPFFKQLFTGQGGEEVLSQDTIDKITAFRDGVTNFFRKVRLLFTGSTGDDKELTEAENNILWFRGKVVEVVGKIKDGVVRIWGAIVEFVKNVSTNGWKGVKTGLSNLISTIGGFFSELFGGLAQTISQGIKNALGAYGWIIVWIGVIGLIIFAIVKIVKVIKTVYSVVTDFAEYLKSITKKEKPKELSEKLLEFAASIALIAGSIYLISQLKPADFWKAFARLSAIVAILAGFAVLAGIFGKGAPGKAIAKIADGLMKFASSLAILTGAIIVLAILDPNLYKTGMVRLTLIVGLLLGMSALTALISKISNRGADNTGVLAMAKTLLILVVALEALSFMSNGRFVNGLVKLTFMMGLLLGFTYLFGRISKSGGKLKTKGFASLSASLLILAGVAALISVIPIPNFVKGIVGIAALMGLLLGFIAVLNKVNGSAEGLKPSGLLAISGVLLALTIIVALLGILPISVLIKGILGLAAVMLIMGVFIRATRKVTSIGGKKLLKLIPIIAALGLITGGFAVFVKQFSKVTWPQLAKALVSFGAVIVGLVVMMKAMTKRDIDIESSIAFLVSALALIGMMSAFGYALSTLKDVSAGQMLSFAASFAIALAAFLGAIFLVGKMGKPLDVIKSAGTLAVSIGILVAALWIIVAGIGKLDDTPVFKGAFERGITLLMVLGQALSNFKENGLAELGIIVGIMLGLSAVASFLNSVGVNLIGGAAILAVALIIIVAAITLIVGGLGYLDQKWNGGLSKAIENGGKVLAAISGAIKAFIDGFKDDLVADIEGFSSAMSSLATTVDGMSEDQDLDADIQKALDIADKMKGFFDSIGGYGVDLSGIEGYNTSAAALSSDIGLFGEKIGEFRKGVGGLDADETIESDTDTAIEIAKYIKENFFDVIGGEDYLPDGEQLETYNDKISTVIDNVGTFGTNMGLYHDGVSGFDTPTIQADTQAAIDAALEVARFMEEVGGMDIETKLEGILGWFQGDTKQDTVAGYVVKLAESIAGAKDKFADLASGGITENVTAAIGAFKEVAKFLTFLSDERIQVSPTAVKSTGGFGDYIDVDKLLEFTGNFSELGDAILAFSQKLEGIDIQGTAALVQSVVDFLNFAKGGIAQALTGLDDMSSGETGGKLGEIIASMSSALEARKEDFKNAGINFDLGLTEGITEQEDSPVTAAGAMAQKMIDKVNAVLDEHSPSEVTKQQGRYFTEGLAEGVEEKADEAEKAAGGVGEKMISAVAGIVEKKVDDVPVLSSLVSEKDIEKGLTSVVDMVDGESGIVGTINGLFSGLTSSDGEIAKGIENVSDMFSGLVSPDGDIATTVSGLFGSLSDDLSIDSIFKSLTDGAESIPGLSDLFNADSIEGQVQDLFGMASSYGDEFAKNYNFDKMLRGDLKYGSKGEAVKQMQEQLMSLGYNLDKFGADGIFGPETQAAVNSFKKDMGLAVDGVFDSSAQAKIVESLTGESANAEYSAAGKTIFSSILSGLSSGDTSSTGDFVNDILKSVTDKSEKFKTAGSNFAIGLANGVYFKAYLAVEQARVMAQQMVDAVKSAFKVASPSKVMAQVGRYFSQGLSQGVEKDGVSAVKSSKDVAENMINAAKGPMASLSRLLQEDMDLDPVIRPVVDMSNVDAFYQGMSDGSFYFDAGVDIGRASRQNANAVSELINRGNGNTLAGGYKSSRSSFNMSDIKAETEFQKMMAKKFDELGERMSSMKIVLDTGELVGATSSAYDKQFGRMSGRRERGN